MTPRIAFLLSLLALLVPLGALWWHARSRWATRAQGLAALIAPMSLAIVAFCSGPWSFTSQYLKYLLPLALAVAAVRATHRPSARASRNVQPLSWALGAAFTVLAAVVVSGFFYSGSPVALDFPLRSGTYAVMQGGNSALMNPFHWSDPSERYALDVVKLNRFGTRARRVIPGGLGDYEIFGTIVYSPCAGQVARVIGDRPDNPPGFADLGHPPGNHVLLRCGDAWVLLAHLQQGSLQVRPGDRVPAGQPLGRVGNSGNTSEPHLHVQATRAPDGTDPLRGTPVPLLFGGRFLIMNDIVARDDPHARFNVSSGVHS